MSHTLEATNFPLILAAASETPPKTASWWENVASKSVKESDVLRNFADPPQFDLISEAGIAVFDAAYLSRYTFSRATQKLINKQKIVAKAEDRDLDQDNLHVATKNFHLLAPPGIYPSPQARLPSTTHGSFSRAFSDVCRAGTLLLRLEALVRTFGSDPKIGGSIRMAFARGVDAYIQDYRAKVLQFLGDSDEAWDSLSLIDLIIRSESLRGELEYLAVLCRCDDSNEQAYAGQSSKQSFLERIPFGAELLSYLYRCTTACTPRRLPLNLAIFRVSARPFLLQISQWVFSGSVVDEWNEFGIEICGNSHYQEDGEGNEDQSDWWTDSINTRSNTFWPAFITEETKAKIVYAGKCVRMALKQDPTHVIGELGGSLESLSVCLTARDSNVLKRSIEQHVAHIEQGLKKRAISLVMKRMREEEEEKERRISEVKTLKSMWQELESQKQEFKKASIEARAKYRMELDHQVADTQKLKEKERQRKIEEEEQQRQREAMGVLLQTPIGKVTIPIPYASFVTDIATELALQYDVDVGVDLSVYDRRDGEEKEEEEEEEEKVNSTGAPSQMTVVAGTSASAIESMSMSSSAVTVQHQYASDSSPSASASDAKGPVAAVDMNVDVINQGEVKEANTDTDTDGIVSTPSTDTDTDSSTDSDKLQLSVTGLLQIPLPQIIHNSVINPVTLMSQQSNMCALHLLYDELGLTDHIEALRRYLLLQAGDFGDRLIENISNAMMTRHTHNGSVLSVADLNHHLSMSLHDSGYDYDELSKNLCFKDVRDPIGLESGSESLCLHYTVPHSLRCIVSPYSLTLYRRIFEFLMSLKRAIMILGRCWTLVQTARSRNSDQSPAIRQILFLMHEMRFFVDAFSGYVTSQVLENCYDEYNASVSLCKTPTIDSLRKLHDMYLENCAKACMLSDRATPVLKVIKSIVSLVYRFHSTIQKHSVLSGWESGSLENVDVEVVRETSDIHEKFTKYCGFFFELGRGLVAKGFENRLNDLLLKMDYNSFYSHSQKR